MKKREEAERLHLERLHVKCNNILQNIAQEAAAQNELAAKITSIHAEESA